MRTGRYLKDIDAEGDWSRAGAAAKDEPEPVNTHFLNAELFSRLFSLLTDVHKDLAFGLSEVRVIRSTGEQCVTVRVYVVMLAWFEFGKRDSLESLRWISSRLGTDLNYSTRHPHVTVGSVAAISLCLVQPFSLAFGL